MVVDEWSHFVCERARVIMQAGPAALTVYNDDEKTGLRQSEHIPFTVEPGRPVSVRLWLRDNVTGELMRLGNPRPSRPSHNSSDMAVERKEGEAVGSAVGRLILPLRMKFNQLVLSCWTEARTSSYPTPITAPTSRCVSTTAPIFELPDGGALQK